MPALLTPAYLPPVTWFQAIRRAGDQAVFEQWAHYRKQTYFNRAVIDSESGPQALTIPTVGADGEKQYLKDVRISDHGEWRRQHWNAIASAYMNSPFFMYYADDFAPFYQRKWEFLLDFNMELTHLILDLAHIQANIGMTAEYQATAQSATDLRHLVDPKVKDNSFQIRPYWQVFQARRGFQAGLSAIDLLFETGPEFKFYL